MENQNFDRVPWFGEYEGADAKDGLDVLAAQHMVLLLQRMKQGADGDHPLASSTVKQLQDAAAHYMISGNTTYGDLIGLDPDETARIGEEAKQYVQTNFRNDFTELLVSMEAHTDKRVAGFVPFAREVLTDRYPDDPPEFIESKLGRYAAAYVKDHGTPLFTADGMKPMDFPGADDLPSREEKEEFKELKRGYHFGPISDTDRELRQEHFLQKELAQMHKSESAAEIDRKIAEREYGERLDTKFAEKDRARTTFVTFAREEIRRTTEIEPADRFHKLYSVMTEYDRQHFPHMRDPGSPWHPSDHPPSSFFRALTERFDQGQKAEQSNEPPPEGEPGTSLKKRSRWRFGF